MKLKASTLILPSLLSAIGYSSVGIGSWTNICGIVLFSSLASAAAFKIADKMHLKQLRMSNKQTSLAGKRVLIVGGTSGIGAGAAIKFAEYGASVTIAGRNELNGALIVEEMRLASPTKDWSLFHFLPVDVSLMADVNRFTKEYMKINTEGLDTLVITSGVMSLDRKQTVEGHDHGWALCYLGRFLLINNLLPLLSKAPGARVMSILAAGKAGVIDFDDIEMKKPGAYSVMQAKTSKCIANDLMVEELAIRNKGSDISFFHVHPGFVGTDILRNSGIPFSQILTPLMKFIGTRTDDYAEVVVNIVNSPDYGPKSSGGLDPRAKATSNPKYKSTPVDREKLWNYSLSATGLKQVSAGLASQ